MTPSQNEADLAAAHEHLAKLLDRLEGPFSAGELRAMILNAYLAGLKAGGKQPKRSPFAPREVLTDRSGT